MKLLKINHYDILKMYMHSDKKTLFSLEQHIAIIFVHSLNTLLTKTGSLLEELLLLCPKYSLHGLSDGVC